MHLRTSSAPRFNRAWCGPLTPPPLHRMRCLREPRKIQRRRQNCTKAVSVLCCASQMIVSQASIRRNPNRSPGTTLVPFPRGKSSRRFTDPASVYQQMMGSVAYFGLVRKGAKREIFDRRPRPQHPEGCDPKPSGFRGKTLRVLPSDSLVGGGMRFDVAPAARPRKPACDESPCGDWRWLVAGWP